MDDNASVRAGLSFNNFGKLFECSQSFLLSLVDIFPAALQKFRKFIERRTTLTFA
jgi:hypothetical protein